MKKKITIIFKGNNAYVELNKEQFDLRTTGLIQFLSELCSHISYNVHDAGMKTEGYDKSIAEKKANKKVKDNGKTY